MITMDQFSRLSKSDPAYWSTFRSLLNQGVSVDTSMVIPAPHTLTAPITPTKAVQIASVKTAVLAARI